MKYLVQWVSGNRVVSSIRLFDTIKDAKNSVHNWWEKNGFKPPYIRELKEDNMIIWDYGSHRNFYQFLQVDDYYNPEYIQIKYVYDNGRYKIVDILYDDIFRIIISDLGNVHYKSSSTDKKLFDLDTLMSEEEFSGICRTLREIVKENRHKIASRANNAKINHVKTMGFS